MTRWVGGLRNKTSHDSDMSGLGLNLSLAPSANSGRNAILALRREHPQKSKSHVLSAGLSLIN